MKHILLIGALSLLGSTVFAEDASEYTRLYQADVLANDTDVNGDAIKAQAVTDCHMQALASFPETIQHATFLAASQTQNYEEARKVFFTLVAEAITSSDTAKSQMQTIIADSKALNAACMADIQS